VKEFWEVEFSGRDGMRCGQQEGWDLLGGKSGKGGRRKASAGGVTSVRREEPSRATGETKRVEKRR